MARKQSTPNFPKNERFVPTDSTRTFFRTNGKTDEHGPAGFKTKAIHETLKGYARILLIFIFIFSIALHQIFNTY